MSDFGVRFDHWEVLFLWFCITFSGKTPLLTFDFARKFTLVTKIDDSSHIFYRWQSQLLIHRNRDVCFDFSGHSCWEPEAAQELRQLDGWARQLQDHLRRRKGSVRSIFGATTLGITTLCIRLILDVNETKMFESTSIPVGGNQPI